MNCTAGYYALTASINCTACPQGTYGASASAPGCIACPRGTRSEAAGSTQCSACGEAEVCPLGSSSALTASSAAILTAAAGSNSDAVVTTTDPLDATIQLGSVSSTSLQIGVAVTAAILIFIMTILYTFFRREPRVKALLRALDLFYDLVHRIPEGAPQMRRSRGLGGFFSVVALVVLLALVSVAIIQYQLVPNYTRSLSPKAAPLSPVGIFNFSLTLYGAPGCDAPVIDGPTSAQLLGTSAQGWRLDRDGSCRMFWACATCVFVSSVLTTSFTLVDPNAYAAALEYSMTFPGFATASDGSSSSGSSGSAPFVLSDSLRPDAPLDSVFRGSSPIRISVSLVPVVLRSSPPQVGTFAQLIGVVPGSQVNGVRAFFLSFIHLFSACLMQVDFSCM